MRETLTKSGEPDADIKGKSKFQGTEARVCAAWLGRAQKLVWQKQSEWGATGEGTEAGATALSGEGPRVSFTEGLSF